MRRFHVIATTPDLASTLVIETAAGWLLPWLDDNPKVELPKQIERMLRPLVSTFDVVHEAPLPDVASAQDIVQGYCAVVADGPPLSAHVTFVANSDLEVRPAVLMFQRQAWSLALERLRAPVADFDSATKVMDALAWIERQVTARAEGRVLSMTRHRCSRHEYVVRLESTVGTMYFKGGTERVADEGVLTALLHALDARVVPQTLALDVAAGRWIYRELPGKLLSESMLTMDAVTEIVRVLARLQKRAVASPSVCGHLAARRLTAVDLFEAADRTLRTTFGHDFDSANGAHDVHEIARVAASWRSSRDALLERCITIDRLNIPCSLVLSDFWSRNILQTQEGVGFIDLERCYWSYPFLPLWRFTSEVERTLKTGGVARAQVESAFVAAWSDVVSPDDMRTALAELPLLGRLFNLQLISRELDLRERDLGTPLSFRHRAVALSRQVHRVLDSLGDSATSNR
jgi:hypothetical protein